MTLYNTEIADKFNKLANLLEIEGANPFRIIAYRNAARIIAGYPKNIADLVLRNVDLTELPSIGNDLAEKIRLLVTTGELPLLKEIEERTPPILNELMKIPGLGPKRIQVIYKKLKIKNADDLQLAIAKGRLRKLSGFGEKTEQRILQGIAQLANAQQRIPLASAFHAVKIITHYLRRINSAKQIECAGSFRRRKETVGDLDIVVTSAEGEKIIDYFVRFEQVKEIISQGITRSTVRLHSGIQVDLRVVPKESYGAALLYFTGSKDHNIAIRKLALKKKLKINEYGVFKGKKYIAGRSEADVYQQVDLPYIPPELREDRGEIEAAQQHCLPKLITLKDIRGDLHCRVQTKNLAGMAQAAEELGYEYLATAARFDKKTLLAHIRAIDKFNAQHKTLRILKAAEVDILANGELTLPNTLLSELDLTICTIAAENNVSQEKLSERIIRAMDNPHVTILACAFPFAMENIMVAAQERGCLLELNAQASPLCINDMQCKMAKEIGVKFAISSHADQREQLATMQFGLYQARRGWLTKKDVANAYSLKDVMKLLKRN